MKCVLCLILCGAMFVTFWIKSGAYSGDRLTTFLRHSTEKDYKRTITQERKEVCHIAFLKVHKTGSGTMKQMFLKFGHERNLTFVLPNLRETRMRGVISEVDTLTNRNILLPPTMKSYDILCCHVIYNRQAFKEILPSDTVYIGIVREPISRFQSAINFYEPPYILELEGHTPLSTFSANPPKYEPHDPRLSMTNNRMAVDFGFPVRLFPGNLYNYSTSEINNYINHLDEDFKLIIVNELFDESLVLMKRILHWQIKDILYVKKHVAKKPSERKKLKETDKASIRKFLYLDNALYMFAVRKLNKQIKNEREGFHDEVNHFKQVAEMVKEYCDIIVDERPLVIKGSIWNDEFEVTKEDCALLKMNNLNDKQRIRSYGSLN